jgi:ABC-type Na+ efflux pump permease subunit
MVVGKSYCPVCIASPLGIERKKSAGKTIAAGVLGIIAGILCLITGGVLTGLGFALGGREDCYYTWSGRYCGSSDEILWFLVGPGIALLVLSILSIVGSAIALTRRNYAIAVAGSVFAFLSFWPLGLPALILMCISKDDFKS